MLISYEHNFIFIHVPKTGGSSIHHALLPYARPPLGGWGNKLLPWLGGINRLGKLYLRDDFRVHATAATVRRCLPREVYARAFKFAFVRNPWSRLVSRYAFLCRTKSHRHYELVKQMTGFEDYLRWELARREDAQHPFVTNRRGELTVDFVGRFENLEADFVKVCERLALTITLPRVNTTVHRDYRTYYTPTTRDLVAQRFRRDIELFGYTFEGQ